MITQCKSTAGFLQAGGPDAIRICSWQPSLHPDEAQLSPHVVPAHAGTHSHRVSLLSGLELRPSRNCALWLWVPAFAGTTARIWLAPPPTLNKSSTQSGLLLDDARLVGCARDPAWPLQ